VKEDKMIQGIIVDIIPEVIIHLRDYLMMMTMTMMTVVTKGIIHPQIVSKLLINPTFPPNMNDGNGGNNPPDRG